MEYLLSGDLRWGVERKVWERERVGTRYDELRMQFWGLARQEVVMEQWGR